MPQKDSNNNTLSLIVNSLVLIIPIVQGSLGLLLPKLFKKHPAFVKSCLLLCNSTPSEISSLLQTREDNLEAARSSPVISNNEKQKFQLNDQWQAILGLIFIGSVVADFIAGYLVLFADRSSKVLRSVLFTCSVLPLTLQVFLFWIIEWPQTTIAKGCLFGILNFTANIQGTLAAVYDPNITYDTKHIIKDVVAPSLYGTSEMQVILLFAAWLADYNCIKQHKNYLPSSSTAEHEPANHVFMYKWYITCLFVIYFGATMSFRSIVTKETNPLEDTTYLGLLLIQGIFSAPVLNVALIHNPKYNFIFCLVDNSIMQAVFTKVETPEGNYDFARNWEPYIFGIPFIAQRLLWQPTLYAWKKLHATSDTTNEPLVAGQTPLP